MLLADIRAKAQELGLNLGPQQNGLIVRELGFETKKVGGQQYVYTGGAKKLAEVGRSLGVQDEWIEQEFTTAGQERRG